MKDRVNNYKNKILKFIKNKKGSFSLFEVLVIVVITTITGALMGTYFTNKQTITDNVKISNNDKYLNEFIEAYNTLVNNYYVGIDRKKIIQDAIDGMTSDLGDIHTSYFSKEKATEFNNEMTGEYYGLGVEINLNEANQVYITRVFDDSPALKAGLKPGDVFIKVNNKEVAGLKTSEVVSIIKENKNKKDIIVINRDNQQLSFEISKTTLDIPSVNSKTFEYNDKLIGYISLGTFSETTYTQFKKHLENLENDNIEALLLDVRGNSGGYLDIVTKICSLFVDKKQIIYQMEEKGKITKYYSLFNNKREYKIGVLTDKASASASEMLAAFIKEGYKGEVIGTNTYGKGTVQQTKILSDGSMIKFTTKRWLTPLGNSIDKVGVTPTVEQAFDPSYYENPSDEKDSQLQKGLEVISK